MSEDAKTEEAETRSPAEAKRDQILSGAREVFFARGFAGASMGEIARVAGVSKGTLYVYFDNKEALFHALISEQERNTAERLTTLDTVDCDIEAALTGFAIRFIEELTAPDHVSLARVVIGAVESFPEVGRAFFENGAAYGARRLGTWLQAQVDAGVLKLDDPEDAAWRFFGMCNTPALSAVFMGMPRPERPEIERRAKAAVKAFLAASR